MSCCWQTLDCGEQALVTKLSGTAVIKVGPKRLFLWRKKFELLDGIAADQNEYLHIVYHTGKIEHMPGPCLMFFNPLEHISLTKVPSISLDANEVLVVYRREEDSKHVTRYIQHGPTLFIPSPNEWLHEFCWHGTKAALDKDPFSKTLKTVAHKGANKFTKLKVIPDQFYYNVDEVRTADDALIRVKLMMFYELQNIEKMLNTTQDPMADFINCLCADVVAFASKQTYMEFIEKSAELNLLKNYQQLTDRCEVIGYKVSNVVFRGYYAAPQLQQMLDDSISERTDIKLQYEKEQQLQQLTDMQLEGEMQRIAVEQQMELDQVYHNNDIEK